LKKFINNTAFFLTFLLILFGITYLKSIQAILQHGITWHVFIIVITFYLIWNNRRTYFNSPLKSNYVIGTLALLFSFLFLFVGHATSTLVISEFALIAGFWGITIFIGGFNLLKKMFWPLLYLFFVSSAIEGAFDIFTPFYRKSTAFLSVYFANILGYDTVISGTYIRLPTMVLNVADECSGINHLISLFAISIPLAILTQEKWWKAITLIGLSIPISLCANSIRVLILILYNYNRMSFTHGPKNFFVTDSGFFIGLIALFACSVLLSKILRSGQTKTTTPESGIKPVTPKQLIALIPILGFGSLISLFWVVKPDKNTPQFSNSDQTIMQYEQPGFSGFDSLPEVDMLRTFTSKDTDSDSWFIYIGWLEHQTQSKEVAGYLYDKFFTFEKIFKTPHCNSVLSEYRTYRKKSPDDLFEYLIYYKSKIFYTSNPFLIKLYTAIDAALYRTTSCSIIIIAIPEGTSVKLNGPESETFSRFCKIQSQIQSFFKTETRQ
jgi:exosortase